MARAVAQRGRSAWRRPLAVWLLLFATYAATAGLDAVEGERYGGDEPRYLLVAESIVSDGDLDLADEYRDRAYTDFHAGPLAREGSLTSGRAHEPQGVGLPLLIAPAYALAGPTGAMLWLAALSALAFALALPLARRVVADPWATSAVVVAGLSPPALAYGTAVYPELVAGGVLVAASLLALGARESARPARAYAAAALLATLPWLGTKYLVPGLAVAVPLVHWTARGGRGLRALVTAEIMVGSLVVYVTVNETLFGGLTPYAAAATTTGASSLAEYLDRLPRLAGLWIDRADGLLRWAPFAALAGMGAFALWRSLSDRVARALPERREAEAAAGLTLAICAGAVLVAAFAAPSVSGAWFGPRHLVVAMPAGAALAAWGLRRAPRAGAALAAVTLLAGVWLVVDLLRGDGGWADPGSDAPLGPLLALLPRFGTGSAGETAASLALLAALAALVAHEWRRRASLRR